MGSSIALFFHLSRFRFPLALALIPFAAFAVDRAGILLHERRPMRASVLVLSALAVLLWLWRPLPAGLPRIRIADYAVTNLIACHLAEVVRPDVLRAACGAELYVGAHRLTGGPVVLPIGPARGG